MLPQEERLEQQRQERLHRGRERDDDGRAAPLERGHARDRRRDSEPEPENGPGRTRRWAVRSHRRRRSAVSWRCSLRAKPQPAAIISTVESFHGVCASANGRREATVRKLPATPRTLGPGAMRLGVGGGAPGNERHPADDREHADEATRADALAEDARSSIARRSSSPTARSGCTTTNGASASATICGTIPAVPSTCPPSHRGFRSRRQSSPTRRSSDFGALRASSACSASPRLNIADARARRPPRRGTRPLPTTGLDCVTWAGG